ncbi:MAG: hypothetical protein CL916_10080 [Deltaproteobacteria bacterium]|nr:hypothetical protein [Deltaproteobacteria bacterium]
MIFWFIACGTEKEISSIDVLPQEETPIEVIDEEVGQSDLEDSTDVSGRFMKRMTVAQVRDSMEQITGTRWGGNTSKWNTYSDSLGVPDFQQRMEHDLSPSVIFQKFLNDAAAESCMEWMQGSSSMFSVDPQSQDLGDIRSNIDFLRWQIQGHPRGENPPIMNDYLALYQSVYSRTGDAMEGWNTICIGIFTHPDFWMY